MTVPYPSMLTLPELLRPIVQTLHSDGTPGGVAATVTLRSALGLTPPHGLPNPGDARPSSATR